MASRAEEQRALEERSGEKRSKRPVKRIRAGKEADSPVRRVLESSRTRGQDIRVNHPPSRRI